ncbi:MAG: (2Fe-2S)-binding protein, partial [Lentisphaeria bacterium]|nr:(2Fe-2S)-binding protein [Lentisphaeria bacterium]
MNTVNLTINGKQVSIPAGSTILEAASKLNIKIPTLCYCEGLGCGVTNNPASCRICVVEVERRRNLAPACATPVMEGMVVHTNSQRA